MSLNATKMINKPINIMITICNRNQNNVPNSEGNQLNKSCSESSCIISCSHLACWVTFSNRVYFSWGVYICGIGSMSDGTNSNLFGRQIVKGWAREFRDFYWATIILAIFLLICPMVADKFLIISLLIYILALRIIMLSILYPILS